MNFEFMTIDTPLPPCMPFPRALTGFPVSSTAKVMYCRMLDAMLWNAAEAVEKQWNSQLARRWVLTIPREIPPDQYAVLVREFCEQQFVSKGMIVDFAIHDTYPPGHNPHAHVMLTMRAMDEHGKWLTLISTPGKRSVPSSSTRKP